MDQPGFEPGSLRHKAAKLTIELHYIDIVITLNVRANLECKKFEKNFSDQLIAFRFAALLSPFPLPLRCKVQKREREIEENVSVGKIERELWEQK